MNHLTPRELQTHLADGNKFTLLDIREAWEVAICRLPDAVHIPMSTIPDKIPEIKLLQPLVVYCHHGIRSVHVCHFLAQRGFERVYNLDGGIERWADEIEPGMSRY
ncbi:MAG: sulfurtransferase [Lentisphaeria bacterium]|nr:sulfurtransferase [Candidatus Neomarinimicrobiota bacterium]MCF7842428.1 sulfurtransferase [Lentisphaeria bacterium]